MTTRLLSSYPATTHSCPATPVASRLRRMRITVLRELFFQRRRTGWPSGGALPDADPLLPRAS